MKYIVSLTNLATKASLTAVENKISSVSNLVKRMTITQKLMKLKRKLLIIITIILLLLQNLISTSEDFAARLKQPNLASKSDIVDLVKKTSLDIKLLGFNKRINSNKTKHVVVENELNDLKKKKKL